MKAKKLIRYRLPVSLTFPATHPRKGEETGFIDKIYRSVQDILEEKNGRHALIGIKDRYSMLAWQDIDPKRHTIRGNYDRWVKRFDKIDKGEAVLELYYWDGKPYGKGVEQITICQLGKEDGIGLQALELSDTMITGLLKDNDVALTSTNGGLSLSTIAKNDGLSLEDFKAWFKGSDLSKLMAIIHFTNFRY